MDCLNSQYYNEERSENDRYAYIFQKKLDNGDIAELRLTRININYRNDTDWDDPLNRRKDRMLPYNISLFIGKRKRSKDFNYNKTTGRGTVAGLLCAREMIKDIIDNCMSRGERLVVYATDKRRWDIYVRYLCPLGFVRCVIFKVPHLIYVKK